MAYANVSSIFSPCSSKHFDSSHHFNELPNSGLDPPLRLSTITPAHPTPLAPNIPSHQTLSSAQVDFGDI